MTERETLKQWLTESNNIVFFGGAGVSTESKIPDFRSTDVLHNAIGGLIVQTCSVDSDRINASQNVRYHFHAVSLPCFDDA